MEESFLHTLLSNYIYPYYEKLVKGEEDDAKIKDLRAQLEKSLTAEQLKLMDQYVCNCSLRNEYIAFQMQIKVLNYGVKMGMQMQQSFDKDYYEN